MSERSPGTAPGVQAWLIAYRSQCSRACRHACRHAGCPEVISTARLFKSPLLSEDIVRSAAVFLAILIFLYENGPWDSCDRPEPRTGAAGGAPSYPNLPHLIILYTFSTQNSSKAPGSSSIICLIS